MFALLDRLDRFDEYIKSKGKVTIFIWDMTLIMILGLVMGYFMASAFYGILTTGV